MIREYEVRLRITPILFYPQRVPEARRTNHKAEELS
jgi:hypothetical protein